MVLTFLVILALLAYAIAGELERSREPLLPEGGACPGCAAATEGEWLVCPLCRTLLQEHCPGCGRPKGVAQRFCPWCGGEEER